MSKIFMQWATLALEVGTVRALNAMPRRRWHQAKTWLCSLSSTPCPYLPSVSQWHLSSLVAITCPVACFLIYHEPREGEDHLILSSNGSLPLCRLGTEQVLSKHQRMREWWMPKCDSVGKAIMADWEQKKPLLTNTWWTKDCEWSLHTFICCSLSTYYVVGTRDPNTHKRQFHTWGACRSVYNNEHQMQHLLTQWLSFLWRLDHSGLSISGHGGRAAWPRQMPHTLERHLKYPRILRHSTRWEQC